ncbi:Uncharacterised protein [Klebsiella pneumoniae]|nr:Uncharacterised protein [Klebsiella pneumoniae]
MLFDSRHHTLFTYEPLQLRMVRLIQHNIGQSVFWLANNQ